MKKPPKMTKAKKEFYKKFVSGGKLGYWDDLNFFWHYKPKVIWQFIEKLLQDQTDEVREAVSGLYEMRSVKKIITKEGHGGHPPIFYEELTFLDLWWDKFIKRLSKIKQERGEQ